MITGVMRKKVPGYHPATVADLRRPGGRRARNQPCHPREKQWEPERAAVWVRKQTQPPQISRGKEEGGGLEGHNPANQKGSPPKEEGVGLEEREHAESKWSQPEKEGGTKDDVGNPEGRSRRRRCRSRKTKVVPAPPALEEAAGSGNKGAIPKERPRRREKEDPFPRVEEETLARLRELRFPRKEGDAWERSPFWEKATHHKAAETPRAEPGPRIRCEKAEKAGAPAEERHFDPVMASLQYWGIGLEPPRELLPLDEERKKEEVEKALQRCRRLAKEVRRTEEQVSRTLHLWRAPPAPEPSPPPKEEVAVLGQRPAAQVERGVGNGANPRPPRAAPPNRGRRGRRGPGPLCWNCHLEGHAHRQCPYPRGDFCQDCGQPGVTGPRCPRCESRRGQGARGPNVPQTQGPLPPGGYTPDHPLVQAITQAIDQWARSQATPRPPPGAPTWRQYPR